MMNCWPSSWPMRLPAARANESVAAPGGNGTTMVTGRRGYTCAWALMVYSNAAATSTVIANDRSSWCGVVL